VKAGIAKKLTTTYFIVTLATVISGVAGTVMLVLNQNTNAEIRYQTIPSIEQLKRLRETMTETGKLSRTWTFLAGNKDRARLEDIVFREYGKLDSALHANAMQWSNAATVTRWQAVHKATRSVVDSAITITNILPNAEAYMSDSIVDRASAICNSIDAVVAETEPLISSLITAREAELEVQQNRSGRLLRLMYVVVFASVLVSVMVSLIALRYLKRYIVLPLMRLQKVILDMAAGEVPDVAETEAMDEISEMQWAVRRMVGGVAEKVRFADELGGGDYTANLSLLSENDKFGQALLNMRDDLKRRANIISEQDQRLRAAEKLAGVGNYFLDIETGEFSCSEVLLEILGIDAQHMKQKVDWRTVIAPQFHDMVANAARTAIKTRRKFVASYIIRRISDGKERWVNAVSEYNFNDNGRAVSVFGTIQDITQAKLLELDLQASYQVAREQNSRLLNFSYIVSHNLRMHAVNMRSLLQLMEDAGSDEERKEFMTWLMKASGQMDETLHHLNEIVAMQQSMKLKKEELQLWNVIELVTDQLRFEIAEKAAHIVNEVPANVTIRYNSVFLNNILLNFLSNAIKYAHPERKPEIVWRYSEGFDELRNLKCHVLEIEDNGLGIDLERHGEKLFGMYKTFHGNKDAKGIGLFMARYQIEAMGGTVSVSSTPGKGSIFRMTIMQ
jgi:PAS domain S-box-containing protein